MPLPGCSTTSIFITCPTVQSERTGARAALELLDDASAQEWLDDVADDLVWDIQWFDVRGAPTTDEVRLTLERRGRPFIERRQRVGPELPEPVTCLEEPFVRMDIVATVTTSSGAQGSGRGGILLPGPDLASAQLWAEVPLSGTDWLVMESIGAGCVGEPFASFGFEGSSGLVQPNGHLSVRHDNCVGTYGSWSSLASTPEDTP